MSPDPRRLLDALERIGPRGALVWYGDEGRTELSGHVLANWVIKAVNHLAEEVMVAAGEQMVLDLPPHWKRTVLALAGWSLGLEIAYRGGPGLADAPRVLATDDPTSALAEEADEVLALEPVSLSLRFPDSLPALVRDWAQEVRGSGDRLTTPVGPWSGPSPADVPTAPQRVLVDDDALASAPTALAHWLAGGTVLGPAVVIDDETARTEGVGAL